MTIATQLLIADVLLKTTLVTRVYHSCEMILNKEGKMYPCYPVGGEYLYVGMDDRKGLYAYIRGNGDAVATTLKLQSCARAYDVRTPMRVVFFHDNEDRDRNFLQKKLALFTSLADVTLQKIITDKYRLVKEESDVFDANIDGKVFYMAVDVLVKTILLSDTCANAECEIHQNPLCL